MEEKSEEKPPSEAAPEEEPKPEEPPVEEPKEDSLDEDNFDDEDSEDRKSPESPEFIIVEDVSNMNMLLMFLNLFLGNLILVASVCTINAG